VKFLASQPRPEFLHLLTIADVILDPFPFCGGNTSYEAIAVGAPVITLPGKYLRGRLTHAMYRRIERPSLIASSVEQYVELALQVANNDSESSQVKESMIYSSSKLSESLDDVRAYSEMLSRIGRETS